MTSRRSPALAAFAVLAAAGLVACSPPLPEPRPDPPPAVLPPALSTGQLGDVLADVAATVRNADSELDEDLLAPRATGPAVDIRAAEYTLADAGDDEAITAIPTSPQTLMVPATDTWPRTIMVVTDPPEDLQAPLLLTLVQDNPRAPYRMWSWVRLFPGVQMPATTQPEIGSTEVAELSVPPGEVLERYVDLLTEEDDSEYVEGFVEDPLRSGIAATREAFSDLVGDNGTLAETYQALDDVHAVATADGGAIVVGVVRTVTTITLSDSTLTIGDQTAALLGEDTVESDLAITWLSVVAFAVPPAGTDAPIEVLGAEHSRTEVSGE